MYDSVCEHISKNGNSRGSVLSRRVAVSTYQAPKFPLDTAKCESYVASHRGFVGPYYGE